MLRCCKTFTNRYWAHYCMWAQLSAVVIGHYYAGTVRLIMREQNRQSEICIVDISTDRLRVRRVEEKYCSNGTLNMICHGISVTPARRADFLNCFVVIWYRAIWKIDVTLLLLLATSLFATATATAHFSCSFVRSVRTHRLQSPLFTLYIEWSMQQYQWYPSKITCFKMQDWFA